MTHPVRTALVGFGYAGRTFHAPLIAACPELRLEAVVSRQAEAVAEVWPDARVLTSYDQALADPAIDLIVLATPNDLHATQAEAALNAGKAVVVDKPFTLTAAEARCANHWLSHASTALPVKTATSTGTTTPRTPSA